MWGLARGSGALDLNSPYAYLLFCDRFSETCIIAEADGEPAGFVLGFRPPAAQDVLFVWQIGVAPAQRGGGLGIEMLTALLARLAGEGVRYLEATVTPTNVASQRLFQALARRLKAPYEESATPVFPREVFPEGAHEEERGIRIGPFEIATAEPTHAATPVGADMKGGVRG